MSHLSPGGFQGKCIQPLGRLWCFLLSHHHDAQDPQTVERPVLRIKQGEQGATTLRMLAGTDGPGCGGRHASPVHTATLLLPQPWASVWELVSGAL